MTKQERFIFKSKSEFGDVFDYSKVDFKNNRTKVVLICPTHGEFSITPVGHLNSKTGCPCCSKERVCAISQISDDEYIRRFRKVHGNKYDYSKSVFRRARDKITIICPEHGEFEQCPDNHMRSGCVRCGRTSTISHNRLSIEQFKTDASLIHNNTYNYDLVNFESVRDVVTIICPEHGEFNQVVDAHRCGCGCPVCAVQKQSESNRLSLDEFIIRSRMRHGDKYSYDAVEYVNSSTYVKIICPIHGEFEQLPLNHYRYGCSKCANSLGRSVKEVELFDCVKAHDSSIESSNRSLISPYEIDIYSPKYQLAIEYNGLYWHSETNGKDRLYHINKTNLCSYQNVELLHIFEKESLDVWMSCIFEYCDLNNEIEAGLCDSMNITQKEVDEFYLKNSIDFAPVVDTHIGYYYDNELVCILSKGEVAYYCELNYTKVNGVIEQIEIPLSVNYRMGNRYKRRINCPVIYTPPNDYYTRGIELVKKSDTLPDVRYHRIWDCGRILYIKSD